jgi:hypothetical protein
VAGWQGCVDVITHGWDDAVPGRPHATANSNTNVRHTARISPAASRVTARINACYINVIAPDGDSSDCMCQQPPAALTIEEVDAKGCGAPWVAQDRIVEHAACVRAVEEV